MLFLEKVLKRKKFIDLNITEKQKEQINEVLCWLNKLDNNDIIKESTVISLLPLMIKSGVDDLYVRRLKWKFKYCRRGTTLFKFLILYGRKGYDYWNEYKEKQAYTNTFEYKNKKYGWTKQKYDEYNKSRAVTIDNLILKHGEKIGRQIWKKYKEKQAYSNTIEYYIEKYDGNIIKANKEFSKYNKSKAVTYDNLMKKYNNEEKVLDILSNKFACGGYYSKISQKIFNRIYDRLPYDLKIKTYYGSLNKEFGKYNHILKKYFMFDFVISNIKFCIEFNGDHYHANPLIYKPDDIPVVYPKEKKFKSKKIWEKDKNKLNTLTMEGFDYIIIWEKNINDDEEKTIDKCMEKINEKYKLFKKL